MDTHDPAGSAKPFQAAVEKGYLKVGASLQLTAPPYYGTGDRPNYGGGR